MEQKTCCFFGHREYYGLDEKVLLQEMEKQIARGITHFYLGNQGQFDSMVRSAIKKMKKKHPYIQYAVVLAYLPERKDGYDYEDTIYPEGIESVPRRFAILKRNSWMIDRADICICYIHHTWGGAYNAVMLAKKKKIEIINLGPAEL